MRMMSFQCFPASMQESDWNFACRQCSSKQTATVQKRRTMFHSNIDFTSRNATMLPEKSFRES